MEYTFIYQILVGIYLSDQEFEFLTTCIRGHKQTAHAAENGRFWYGNMIRRRDCIPGLRPKCVATITIKQLEKVLLKSLEPYVRKGHEDQHERNFAIELHTKLHTVSKDAYNEAKLLNDSGIIYNTKNI
jgi:hypothetical protein